MALSTEAVTLYQHLRTEVLPTRRVTTYGDVSRANHIPIGPEGGHIGKVLGEVAAACDMRGLPPLTAIVVRADGCYDPKGKHGMPGAGYFVQEANSPNHALRTGHDDFLPWAQNPPPADFDKDADRWALRPVIEAHQDTVWAYRRWPERI